MGKINKLSQNIINKIAAGEVVERPASVVKELIENSIDAEAEQITVKIEQGGSKLIEVSDNGKGMDEADAMLAFEQHATSKLVEIEDLEKIMTLGFRGEALASISSVSEAEIHTFDGDSAPLKATTSSGGTIVEPASARTRGTTITIRNLFHNIPARRKFLRTPQTEAKHIQKIFIEHALTNPNVAFTFIKDDKIIYELTAEDKLEQRIIALFPSYANQLVELNYDSPQLKLAGYVGHPAISINSTKDQYLFINKRPISDHLLSKAVKDAFDNNLMKGKYPVFFINIELAPDLVDVNIHPRKQEVRFESPGLIYSSIRRSVNHALQNKLHSDYSDKLSTFPETDFSDSYDKNLRSISNVKADRQATTPGYKSKSFADKTAPPTVNNKDFTKINDQEQLMSEFNISDTSAASTISYLQVFNTYLIFQKGEKLLVVDQHAADERINFEKIRSRINSSESIATQALLIPEELSGNTYSDIEDYLTHLAKLGFVVEPLTKSSYQLTEIPALLSHTQYLQTLDAVIEELSHTSGSANKTFEDVQDDIFATMACHGSIRAGQKLSEEEAYKILSDLFTCELPYSCPHGRPIIWELTKYELEKQFKRKL